jgi:hypothetical protein
MDDTDKKQDQNDQVINQENQDTAIFEILKKQSDDYLKG